MLLALLLLSTTSRPPEIHRDSFGVPRIHAANVADAFFQAGYAVAQDRLWQMENSRRLSRGHMAEVFGKAFVASDREVLRTFYTDEELQQQLNNLSPQVRGAFDSYAKGVNAYIDEAKSTGKLPEGYTQYGFGPEPWTAIDSAAISVRLFQQFGTGGAGELRNMAFYTYLNARKQVQGRVVDVLDDALWQNEPSALTTIPADSDPLAKSHPTFPIPSREVTEKHLQALPKVGLFELIGAIGTASNEQSKRVAELVNVPYHTGSYCIVVAPQKSGNGRPILLSGPQMGFRNPSIVHEISIDCPEIQVAGADVPGTPGIAVGYTPKLGWGITSGVADLTDIFCFKLIDSSTYEYEGKPTPFEVITRTLKVKSEPDVTVVQKRTIFGPVVLESTGTHSVFSQRTSFFNSELSNIEAFYRLYAAHDSAGVDAALSHANMTFNLFYATTGGQIGYRYTGKVPVRSGGSDPRFPTLASKKNDWQGFIPFESMPHMAAPKVGYIANWNNKSVSWWANGDTPVWGEVFRNRVLVDQLSKPKLTAADLELAAWSIARLDDTYPFFKSYLEGLSTDYPDKTKATAAAYLKGFDGRLTDGSIGATLYLAFVDALREELFMETIGNMFTPEFFRLGLQPSMMLKALQGKTKVNYLGTRKASDVVNAAFENAYSKLVAKKPAIESWRYAAPGIRVAGETPIPYSNRGTYIQVLEMLENPIGRNVLPPGVAETGDHSKDQVALARAWMFKPFGWK